ncbi:uncharacterized protein [Ptychodera flava]|uniref:uncharacterized protein n=1 Tax=Ptychodera flava TaxID=63121 RepID=UPI00396AAE9D
MERDSANSYRVGQSMDPLNTEKRASSTSCNRIFAIILAGCVVVIVFLVIALCVVATRPVNEEHDYGVSTYTIPVRDERGNLHFSAIRVNIMKGEEVFYDVHSSGDGDTVRATKTDLVVNETFYEVRDVNKKLDATVEVLESLCYLSPYNANDEVSPVELDAVLAASSPEDVEFTDELTVYDMYVDDVPIEDVSEISDIIADHCSDKTSYWEIPVNVTTTCGGNPCEDDDFMPLEIPFLGQSNQEMAIDCKLRTRVCKVVTKRDCRRRRPRRKLVCSLSSKLSCKWVCDD